MVEFQQVALLKSVSIPGTAAPSCVSEPGKGCFVSRWGCGLLTGSECLISRWPNLLHAVHKCVASRYVFDVNLQRCLSSGDFPMSCRLNRPVDSRNRFLDLSGGCLADMLAGQHVSKLATALT